MKQISIVRRPAFSIFAVVALALAVAGNSASAMTSVPIKATVTASLSITNGTELTLLGIGDQMTASHLGKISYSASGTYDPTTATDVLTETLVAANGDTLILLCFQTLTIAPPLATGIDTATVIGGTGRFSGATGTLSGTTSIDLNTGIVIKTFAGTISY